jgi:hypothetical protein
MGLLTRRALLLAIAVGAAASVVLWRTFEDPCRNLAKGYAEVYATLGACGGDGDCVVDPPAAHGPRLCEPVRAASASRERLESIERTFEARACPLLLASCPDPRSARCDRGRCRAVP